MSRAPGAPRRAATIAAAVLALAAGTGPTLSATAAPAVPGASSALQAAVREFGDSSLGRNVLVFSPSDPLADIQAALDAVAAAQVGNQFGTQRYSLLFLPGTYGTTATPLVAQVGYYTQVAGLGTSPSDVVINGHLDVYNQCNATDGCIALNNFWRSVSNLTIDPVGGQGCRANTEFWAVSQAAPMRRVAVTGPMTLMDYCTAGPQYASGGFIADSDIRSTIVNGSQQQFFVRNSAIGGWSNGVWNQVFSGVTGAPAQSFGQTGAQQYTTVPTTPTSRETPFLVARADGSLAVQVPSTAHDTSGTSWSADAAGRTIPLHRFLVATPRTTAREMNRALARGLNLLLTPGVYDLDQTLRVTHPDTVVMGLGFATLTPRGHHDTLDLRGAAGSVVSGLILDAGPAGSTTLLDIRPGGHSRQHTLVSDVFVRVGGATAGRTQTGIRVSGSHVVLDDIWAWRADHGTGVGWTQNTAATGLAVSGDDVTATGLFVEHFQKTEVTWSGNRGTVEFFQNEMPYDVPSQSAWNLSSTVRGYPAFAIDPRVKTFAGWGMGSYSFFNQGQDIHASEAFTAPTGPGVQLHDLLTVFLNGSGGIDSVLDGQGAAVDAANHGPSVLVSNH